jgi:carboxymethylenebutenolidase
LLKSSRRTSFSIPIEMSAMAREREDHCLREGKIAMNDVLPRHEAMLDAWQRHTHAEFVLKDADATLATMTDNPYILCIPTGMGAFGRAEVRAFYADRFLPTVPPDFELSTVSETIGPDRIVEEFVVRFTHTVEMGWVLPGVPPTGRKIEFALVVMIEFQANKIACERFYWDQATLLSQLGILDHPAAAGGAASAAELLRLSA